MLSVNLITYMSVYPFMRLWMSRLSSIFLMLPAEKNGPWFPISNTYNKGHETRWHVLLMDRWESFLAHLQIIPCLFTKQTRTKKKVFKKSYISMPCEHAYIRYTTPYLHSFFFLSFQYYRLTQKALAFSQADVRVCKWFFSFFYFKWAHVHHT